MEQGFKGYKKYERQPDGSYIGFDNIFGTTDPATNLFAVKMWIGILIIFPPMVYIMYKIFC